MSTNEDTEGDGEAQNGANAASTVDNSIINPGDENANSNNITSHNAASTGSDHGNLTTAQFLTMDHVAINRALSRWGLSPERRADAGQLDPATLSNEQIAAIFHPILVRTYIQTLGTPTTANEFRVLRLLRLHQDRLHRIWAAILVEEEFCTAGLLDNDLARR